MHGPGLYLRPRRATGPGFRLAGILARPRTGKFFLAPLALVKRKFHISKNSYFKKIYTKKKRNILLFEQFC